MNSELVLDLNGLELNSGNTGFYLDVVEGLGFSDLRTSSGLSSGQDGGYVGPQYLGLRPITLEGRVWHANVTEAQALRRQLQAAVASTLKPLVGELRITTYDGGSYLIYFHATDLKMPINGSQNFTRFKLELLAPDPIIYDNATGSELTVPLSRLVPGGFGWDIVWPLIWSPGTGPTPVSNNGTIPVKPTITLSDAMTNPVITNLTTGQLFGLSDFTTVNGDEVLIDMRERTVTLNGGNIMHKIAPNSQWWGLEVGVNNVTLESASGSDNVAGLLTWRNGVMGI